MEMVHIMRQTQVLLARKVPGTQLSISYVAPYTPGPSQKTNTKNKSKQYVHTCYPRQGTSLSIHECV